MVPITLLKLIVCSSHFIKYYVFFFTCKDWVMLGAVGAYDWNGTVVMHKANQNIIPQNTTFQVGSTKMNEPLASYLGKHFM